MFCWRRWRRSPICRSARCARSSASASRSPSSSRRTRSPTATKKTIGKMTRLARRAALRRADLRARGRGDGTRRRRWRSTIGASLVDINMGCPAKRVVAGECGSALMREPEMAQELVRAVRRRGARGHAGHGQAPRRLGRAPTATRPSSRARWSRRARR